MTGNRSTWRNGSTRAWRKQRDRVLDLAGHVCQLKLPGCTYVATEGHHLHGRHSRTDADVVAACHSCNAAVGDPTRANPAPSPRTRWDAQ